MIRCSTCKKTLFDGTTLKVRVAQFGGGLFNAKCPQCKQWTCRISVGVLLGGSLIPSSKNTQEGQQ